MDASLGVQQRSLTQQGYDYSEQELSELSWALRFTPAVCMLFALYGLATQQAWLHFTLAAFGIVPFWFPAWHPFDRLYNHLLRPLWNGIRLPPNPLPRRVACVTGGTMNVIIGFAFLYGNVPLAYVFGFILVPLQLIVISTHFCVASWLFEVVLRLSGHWTPLIPVERAKELIGAGALLVDVRDADEFARGCLPGAVNLPLDQIDQRVDELRGKSAIIYCQSGLRSQRAMQLLQKLHFDQVYNLGALNRWS